MTNAASEIRRFVEDDLLFGEALAFDDGASFIELGFIDSTNVLELVAFVEKRFGVTFEDEDLLPENLDSIANLVRFIETRQRALAA